MEHNNSFIRGIVKTSTSYMMLTAALGIILGLVMLLYPGGTYALMEAAFVIFQTLISIFILYYSITEGVYHIRTGNKIAGFFYILIGIMATIFVWLLNIGVIYYLVAFFLIFAGIADIVGGFRLPGNGKYFLIFLGMVNLLVAGIILTHPLVLPLLIAWYVLFWGISRLFLSLEIRGMFK